MEDRYIFDKRVMKQLFKKYGLMALGIFPVLCVINYFLNQVLDFWVTVVVDITFILLAVFVIELIISAIKNKKEAEVRDDVIVIKKAQEIKDKRKKD
ncbi:MAG: hypothetical protein IKB42_05575 [Clostridia bacterium]|nr:hypothetical protein [Clostridia bacterium]